jgi:hypothetical protein
MPKQHTYVLKKPYKSYYDATTDSKYVDVSNRGFVMSKEEYKEIFKKHLHK